MGGSPPNECEVWKVKCEVWRVLVLAVVSVYPNPFKGAMKRDPLLVGDGALLHNVDKKTFSILFLRAGHSLFIFLIKLLF